MSALLTILFNMYMDDLLKSVDSISEPVCVIKQVIVSCSKYGFNLTKWASNERDVIYEFLKDELSPKLKQLKYLECELPKQKAMGLSGRWIQIDLK